MFALPLVAALVSDGIDVGALIARAATDTGLCPDELWIVQGYDTPAQWDRALAGKAPIDLRRLTQLSNTRQQIAFWSVFLGRLSSALIVRSFNQAFEGMYSAKASIRQLETKGRVRVWS
jgi:hypothetical protein